MDPINRKEIYISLIHYPVQTLGIGKRIGIWVQGCTIHCKGCISKHSWPFLEEKKMPISQVLTQVDKHIEEADGITFSGGECFDQAEAFYTLLLEIRKRKVKDIMVYSGYKIENLQERYPQILSEIDVLIDSPFEFGNQSNAVWKGSENQRMIILTKDKEIQKRYLFYKDEEISKKELQIVEKNDMIYVVGIPYQKDAERIINGLY